MNILLWSIGTGSVVLSVINLIFLLFPSPPPPPEFNYFAGRDQAWLENQLHNCQHELVSGKTLSEWTAADSHSKFRDGVPVERRIKQLYYALHQIAPDYYP